MVGYLEIIAGPMYAGKTSKLIELVKQYADRPCLVINHAADKRYSEHLLVSHDQVQVPCVQAVKLSDIVDLAVADPESTTEEVARFNATEVVLINEAQFFPDIVDWVKLAVEKYGKRVFLCGLDGDFKRQPFGDWLNLLPLCDHFYKLTARCHTCNQPALFSHRLVADQTQMLIGSDIYVPLCRGCYLQAQPQNI